MLSTGPDSAQLRFGLASALVARGELGEALDHARAALALDAEYSAAWRLLGRIYQQRGDLEAAVRTFEQGIAVAERRGDRQLVKEMQIFLARARKSRDGAHTKQRDASD